MMGFSGISDADIENLLISLSRFIDSVKEFILFDIEIFFIGVHSLTVTLYLM